MKVIGTVLALSILTGCTANARQNAALWGMVALTAATASKIAEQDAEAEEHQDASCGHEDEHHASVCHHGAYHHAHACEHGW